MLHQPADPEQHSRARLRLNVLDIILIMIVVAYLVIWLGQRHPVGGC